MKVAIYTRVSTDEQASEGYSLQVQEEFLKDHIQKYGWEIYHPDGAGNIYTDEMSGYKLERPGLQRMMEDARNKKFDMILVYKIDRLSRRLKDLENIRTELETYDVHLKSATEPFDTTDSSGRLMFQQLGAFAEFERSRIKERVFPGMVKGVQNGNWQGSRYSPYGYKYNKQKKELEIVPKEAKTVQTIYEMYLASKSTVEITRHFYEKGTKSRGGGRFHSKFVRDILRNRLYIGDLVWNKYHYDPIKKTKKGLKSVKNDPSKVIIAKGKHKPLIDKKDWEKVQGKLDRNRRGALHRKSIRIYPLTGILFCGVCDFKFRGASNISSHKTGEKKRWYRCDAKHQHAIDCNAKGVLAEVIEPQIEAILEILCDHHNVKEERANQLSKENIVINDKDLREQKEEADSKLKENFKKQSDMLDAYLDKMFTKDIYRDKCIDVRAEEMRLKKEIRKINAKVIEKERTDSLKHILGSIVDGYSKKTKHKLDAIQQKEALRCIFKKVIMKDKKISSIELLPPFDRYFMEAKCDLSQITTDGYRISSTLRPTAVR
ncbi:MAG: recombinase family protein [Candidatus Omnitrophica bacterium]|nr:recombinase family protein [Candidatus Omnitrophota bacterium]